MITILKKYYKDIAMIVWMTFLSVVLLQLNNTISDCMEQIKYAHDIVEETKKIADTNSKSIAEIIVFCDSIPFEQTTDVEEVVEPTMYDKLTEQEIRLIETVVQHEVGNFSKQYKIYVAELIYNRIVSDRFPNEVRDMLFQGNAFQGIASWSNSGIIPDDDTVEAVRYVFTNENPSHTCVAYYNPALSEYESILWFEYSGDVEFVFEHTEVSWGIDYTTRFFRLPS